MNSFTFHEPTLHGTPDFPCEYHYVDTTHPRYEMPFHWHKEWEIIHVIEGTFFAHVEDTAYTATKGDTLLIRGGQLHGGTPKNCIYECILFDLHGLFKNFDPVKKYLRPIYHQRILPQIFYESGKYPQISATIFSLSGTYQTLSVKECLQNPSELIVFGCICELFSAILQNNLYISNSDSQDNGNHKIDLLKNVLEYIEQHYSSAISLDDLAAVAGMNPKYFCRFFRSITHQSPIEYVNRYRIEKAAGMLHGTRLPITDICMECGFNDGSNFIKVFRKYKGMTPGQYRKI